MNRLFSLVDRLALSHTLPPEDYRTLIAGQSEALRDYAAQRADAVRREVYGNDVYLRGLVEIGNVCRNDCYYCGIRRSNRACERYVLDDASILACCEEGYELGFRTFVFQSGEGSMPVERICSLVEAVKRRHSDCAVTLSLGEYPAEDYRRFFQAGADRYLLRHETADPLHYARLHPPELSLANRMRCLRDLRTIGFQVGCGFMVGSPFQTPDTLAEDLCFIERFRPDMCGIGPFIPQKDTPLRDYPAGTAEQTVFLLSLIRLIAPRILLPATTALATVRPDGREMGLRAGGNVVMPNLTPLTARAKYTLYDNKAFSGAESAQALSQIKAQIASIGYRVVVSRGDRK